MIRLVVRRLGFGVLTLWAVSLIVFLATQALPGDAAQAILGREATPERLAALRAQLHVGDPLITQYLQWLRGIVTLDPGNSLANGLPVGEFLGPRIVNSLVLMLCAAAISTPIAMLIGTWTALRRDRLADHATALVTLVLAALPEFVIGILLVIGFATGALHVLPAVRAAPRWRTRSPAGCRSRTPAAPPAPVSPGRSRGRRAGLGAARSRCRSASRSGC